ncbi:hypothetical protein [Gallaecimonas sp. GXIMD4217]|uniref:hypothetical protein n=1 Tax=Gallaecimonas sp. GXIMD4217 TaxID=3131927 RepID=UPI00311B3ED7
MQIQLLVTKNDFSLPNLKKEMADLGLSYEILYIEEHPELVRAHKVRHSPNVLVDGKLAFRRQPSEGELRHYLQGLER